MPGHGPPRGVEGEHNFITARGQEESMSVRDSTHPPTLDKDLDRVPDQRTRSTPSAMTRRTSPRPVGRRSTVVAMGSKTSSLGTEGPGRDRQALLSSSDRKKTARRRSTWSCFDTQTVRATEACTWIAPSGSTVLKSWRMVARRISGFSTLWRRQPRPTRGPISDSTVDHRILLFVSASEPCP
jgi:hypothetical protein